MDILVQGGNGTARINKGVMSRDARPLCQCDRCRAKRTPDTKAKPGWNDDREVGPPPLGRPPRTIAEHNEYARKYYAR
jgi:hypothetical protein